jgi:glucose repression regulatory protein TUP1
MVDGTSMVLAINDHDPSDNDSGMTSVAISPNVAAGSLDTIIRIRDVATGILVERLRGHTDSVYSVAFTLDGKRLMCESLDKTLKYWDVSALHDEGGSTNVKTGGGGKGSRCEMHSIGYKDRRLIYTSTLIESAFPLQKN